jgi:excisionase family DNA binding protein
MTTIDEIRAQVAELVTPKEAAELLKIPLPSVYFYLNNGTLKGRQLGGRWRISLSTIKEFLDGPPTEPTREEIDSQIEALVRTRALIA